MLNTKNEQQTMDEDIKDLVIARILTLPENKEISIGSKGDYSKEELIDHVKVGDAVGKKFVEIELQYLQSLKDLTNQLLSSE